jgi:hypothetical protein
MWHVQARYLLPGESLVCIAVGTSTGSLWRFLPSRSSAFYTETEY